MGGSHSGEGRSVDERASKNMKLKSYSHSVAKYRGLKDKSEPVKNWEKYLLDLIVSLDEEIKYWEYFEKPLVKHIKSDQKQNVSWIANLQCTTLNFPTYHSQLSAREETRVLDISNYSSVVEGNKSILRDVESKSVLDHSLNNHFPKGPPLAFNKSASCLYSPDLSPLKQVPSTKANIASKFMHLVQNERPVKQDLRLNLVNQFSNSAHIVTRLIVEFLNLFDQVFQNELPNEQDTKRASDLGRFDREAILYLVKHFVGVLKDFIQWLYNDLIQQVRRGLDQEDVHSGFIIENLLYEMLFQEKDASLNQLTRIILETKYLEERQRFKEMLERLKEVDLKDYDDCLPNSPFILEGTKQPYEKVIKKLQDVQLKTSPFGKHDVINMLEMELMDSISEHYKENVQMKMKAQRAFGTDIKIPLLTYCIVKSQSADLYIDKMFMEEFINMDYLDSTPSFSSFSACVEYLLMDGDKIKKDEVEKIND